MDTTITHIKTARPRAQREKFRRRNYLVDKKLQLAVAGNMILIVGISMAATALMTVWFFLYFMEGRLSWTLDHVYLIQLGIILFFMMCGIAIWTVLKVHSMAGPVYKTRLILQAAARGEFPDYPVCFRKGDAFKELAEDLNQCLAVMKEAKRPNDK